MQSVSMQSVCPLVYQPSDPIVAQDKLGELRSLQPLHPRTTRAMESLYGFDASKNAEIRGSWYRLCLLAGVIRRPR